MNDFYVYVDFNEKTLLSQIQKLPENWNNINGLNKFDDHQLKDLSWAEYENKGWIRYNSRSLIEYEHTDEWLSLSKDGILQEIANTVKNKTTGIIEFKGKKLFLNLETKSNLMFTRLNLNLEKSKKVPIIFSDGIREINHSDFIDLYDFIDSYTKKCLLIQLDLTNKVKSAQNLEDLQKINFDSEWPSTKYQEKPSIYDIITNIISNIKELILLLIGKN